jgi:hypothetical protein
LVVFVVSKGRESSATKILIRAMSGVGVVLGPYEPLNGLFSVIQAVFGVRYRGM